MFIVIGTSFVKKIQLAITIIIFVVCLFSISEKFHAQVLDLGDVLMTGGENGDGSSTGMREHQFQTAKSLTKGYWTFGMGFHSIRKKLGYINETASVGTRLQDLLSLEGYPVANVMERGYVGIATDVFLWVSLLLYLLSRKKYLDKSERLGLWFIFTWFISWLIFIMGTDLLHTDFFVFLIFGIYAKQLELMVSHKREGTLLIAKEGVYV